MKQYVIIGNGVAAAGCIEGIRSIDSEGVITVVSAENHAVYCRPLISYYLEGKIDLTHTAACINQNAGGAVLQINTVSGRTGKK